MKHKQINLKGGKHMNVNIQLDDEQNKEILNFNLDSKIFGLDYIKSLGKFMVQTRLDKDTCLNQIGRAHV